MCVLWMSLQKCFKYELHVFHIATVCLYDFIYSSSEVFVKLVLIGVAYQTCWFFEMKICIVIHW